MMSKKGPNTPSRRRTRRRRGRRGDTSSCWRRGGGNGGGVVGWGVGLGGSFLFEEGECEKRGGVHVDEKRGVLKKM